MTEIAEMIARSVKAMDSKRLVAEDVRSFIREIVLICSVGISVLMSYDFIINLLHIIGLYENSHPIKFGLLQGLGILFLAPFLVRALIVGRYYF